MFSFSLFSFIIFAYWFDFPFFVVSFSSPFPHTAFVNKDGFLIITPPFEEIRSSPQTVTCSPDDFQVLAEQITTFLEDNFPTESLEFDFFRFTFFFTFFLFVTLPKVI